MEVALTVKEGWWGKENNERLGSGVVDLVRGREREWGAIKVSFLSMGGIVVVSLIEGRIGRSGQRRGREERGLIIRRVSFFLCWDSGNDGLHLGMERSDSNVYGSRVS